MAFLRAFFLVIGILGVLMGLLWLGQGLGIVMWPSSSFMLADRAWAIIGAILVALGLVLVWLARRR